MTVGQLFQKLVDDDPNVTVYDAFKNNCGHFAATIVRTLGLTSNETTTFINQNIDGLVSTAYKKIAKDHGYCCKGKCASAWSLSEESFP